LYTPSYKLLFKLQGKAEFILKKKKRERKKKKKKKKKNKEKVVILKV